jgi:hypothetical protein
MAALDNQLTRLAVLSPAELGEEWRRLRREEPPRLSPDLLRHALCYTLQEKAVGKLPSRIARHLKNDALTSARAARLSPGTQLVRSWNGCTIDVLVVEDGFRFEGKTYRSLSAIAREVTGTAWSGPRFFGLTRG